MCKWLIIMPWLAVSIALATFGMFCITGNEGRTDMDQIMGGTGIVCAFVGFSMMVAFAICTWI